VTVAHEVAEPILNSPFEEPSRWWHIVEGETPEVRDGRRRSIYYYRDPKQAAGKQGGAGIAVELALVQLEAAETIIFLTEGRADFRQGIEIPRDEPSDDRKSEGYTGFLRYACKMATGSGKTTVMGMLASWSILNKINNRGDARFSDVLLVVCPNVTIRDRTRSDIARTLGGPFVLQPATDSRSRALPLASVFRRRRGRRRGRRPTLPGTAGRW